MYTISETSCCSHISFFFFVLVIFIYTYIKKKFTERAVAFIEMESIARPLALLILMVLACQHAAAYYLPGSFPNEYKVNATMMGMCVTN